MAQIPIAYLLELNVPAALGFMIAVRLLSIPPGPAP